MADRDDEAMSDRRMWDALDEGNDPTDRPGEPAPPPEKPAPPPEKDPRHETDTEGR
jgi:hypothetical protein